MGSIEEGGLKRTGVLLLLCVLATGCATLSPPVKPILLLLPAYVTTSPGGAEVARAFASTLAHSLPRYALRQKGWFEAGFDQALLASPYPPTAGLGEVERATLAQALGVDALGLTDVTADREARVWRLRFRIVHAPTGDLLESFTFVLPWGRPAPTAAWRATLALPGRPEPREVSPRLDRSGAWEAWWDLAPALEAPTDGWKRLLEAAREAGNFEEALRLTDLLLDRVRFSGTSGIRPEVRKLLALEEPWVAGDAAWLRQLIVREAQYARDDRDRRVLMAALTSPLGTPAEEDLFLPRFLDLVRETQTTSRSAQGDDVEAAFRERFGAELSVMLTRPPLVFVDGGTYLMGTESGEADEKPQHSVTVASFLMARTEVTQAQYAGIVGYQPSLYTQGVEAPFQPVERVTWYDAVEFCLVLSREDGLEPVYTLTKRSPATGFPIVSAEVTQDLSKNGYRLPTEAEWEWAARGGVHGQGTALAGGTDPLLVAWTDGSTGGPGPVARRFPNELGLYDLSGNVWEWCSDWYGRYLPEVQTNPEGPAIGILKVGRGGSWHAAAWNARTVERSYDNPGSRGANIGFRVVRSVTPR